MSQAMVKQQIQTQVIEYIMWRPYTAKAKLQVYYLLENSIPSPCHGLQAATDIKLLELDWCSHPRQAT